ncbi:MAG: FAD-dependent monooxygenase [Planctomycetes bacterium]|nr:FAD-dependent monooxygenase [Planctomycetota bacterium]
MRVGIVGAGPAGLTAAIAARRLGLEVALFEQSEDRPAIGGGILLHSNGQRVLESLALLESFRPRIRPAHVAAVETVFGGRLSQLDFRELAIPHSGGAVVLRHDLQEHLRAGAEQAGVEVRFGHRFQSLSLDAPGAELRFENGHRHACDVVLAADGVHSPVRDAAGIRSRKRVLGEAYLRGVAERPVEDSTLKELWASDGRRFGICPLPGERAYFYCTVPLGGWQEIRHGRLRGWIEAWATHGPEAVAILKAVRDWDAVNYSELTEVVLERWHRAPVFVVGDAAHAMTPNFGQGANSSMVDALVVAQLLARAAREGRGLAEVGREYEALRKPFVSRVQAAARRAGRVAALQFMPARWLRDGLLRLGGGAPGFQRETLLMVAGYNPSEEPFLCAPLAGEFARPAQA